jgi:hypothetical protein
MNGLPEGWVPLSHFDSKDRGRLDGHSPDYKTLAAAVKDGELRGLQDPKSRRYYVPQDEANRLLITRACRAVEKPKDATENGIAALTAVLSALATNQGTMLVAVERIAFALEQIANQQPLVRMDDISICEPSASSNGFHS